MFVAALIASLLVAQPPAGLAAIDDCHATAAAEDEAIAAEMSEPDGESADRFPPPSAFCIAMAIYAGNNFQQLDPLGEHSDRIFSQAALSEIAGARASGRVNPGFGSNPLCVCDDPSSWDMLITGAQLNSEGGVEVVAVLTNGPVDERLGVYGILGRLPPDARRDVKLVLVRESGGWRVDDILDGEGRSFRQGLQP